MKPIAWPWLDKTGALSDGIVVVAMGGNLGGLAAVRERCTAAVETLSRAWGAAKCSAFLATAPVGAARDQPEFLNAVAAWRPSQRVPPELALAELMGIEACHGRVRCQVGEARTLDLDLLMVGRETRSSAGLVLPHARMHDRAFVLLPLLELFGEGLRLGSRGTRIAELLARPLVRSQETRRFL